MTHGCTVEQSRQCLTNCKPEINIYHESTKFSDTKNIAAITLRLEKIELTIEKCHKKIIWVCTVCLGLKT